MPEDDASTGANLCDITVEYLPLTERSYPADVFRVSSTNGMSWVATYGEVYRFYEALGLELEKHEDPE